MGRHPPLEVVVWGDLACFTRPECKVERVSYPVMTPSTARGVLEAIFWRPEMHWRIREIHVLKPIRWLSIMRNEINSRQKMKSGVVTKGDHYCADADRSQRHMLGLRDVRYRIVAGIELNDKVGLLPEKEPPNEAKFREQFKRRVKKGRCFQQPYLGCREFTCGFAEPTADDIPLAGLSMELGPVLFDMRYRQTGKERVPLGIGGEPVFFDAELRNGILYVPQDKHEEVQPCS